VNNGDQNSRIEKVLGVIRNLLDDIADMTESLSLRGEICIPFDPRKESLRDLAYITSRTHSEGIEFLTTQLPRLGKWYDTLLAERDGTLPVGFKPYYHVNGGSVCPLLCRTLWYVIKNECGSVPVTARLIRGYRSLFYLVYKLEMPIGPDLIAEALVKWRSNEEEIESFDYPAYFDSDIDYARGIICDVLEGLGESIFTDYSPRHGPGAVAGGEDSEMKWATAHTIPSLHSVYPWYDLYAGFRSNGRISPALCGEIIALKKRSRTIEATSRLLFVPKDSRGPRTISCEPKELMFVQQGVGRNLMRILFQSTKGRINFVEQSVNADLALASSLSREYATIDLQDASDRVSTRLVTLLFPDWALKYLLALRSTKTLLPDGTVYQHCKYAPMGSALCFPIESVVFWALSVVAGVKSGMTEMDAKASTYVYGDDIVVKTEVYSELLRIFTRCGLIVNSGKSFVEGPFRESCGTDAWKGEVVTPFRVKKDIFRRSLDGLLATAICEYVSTCFQTYYRKTGEYLLSLVTPYTVVRADVQLGCLSVVDPLAFDWLTTVKHGRSTRACRVWIEGWVLTNSKETSKLDGLSRLLKNQYGSWQEHDPSAVAVPRSAKIRKRKLLVEKL